MLKYLLLAEKISKNIKQDSSNNYLKNLNNLIIEIKKAITGTELKFLSLYTIKIDNSLK